MAGGGLGGWFFWHRAVAQRRESDRIGSVRHDMTWTRQTQGREYNKARQTFSLHYTYAVRHDTIRTSIMHFGKARVSTKKGGRGKGKRGRGWGRRKAYLTPITSYILCTAKKEAIYAPRVSITILAQGGKEGYTDTYIGR